MLRLTQPETLHHLRTVLRAQAGMAVRVFNASSGEYAGVLQALDKKQAEVLLQQQTRAPQATPALTLYFAPLKRTETEWLIEKATELGATHVQPVITARTQGANVRAFNLARLQALALAATEQSERLHVPKLSAPITLAALVAQANNAPIFWAAEDQRAETPHLMQVPWPANQASNKTPNAVGVLIGPEGGFAPEEVQWLTQQAHIMPVSLGAAVLRAETAGMLAVGLLAARLAQAVRDTPHD